MAKINIPGLVQKRRNWFWQPSATLRKAGWTSMPLGADLNVAMDLARKQNLKIEQWRNGGAAPRQVKKFIKGGTMAQLIARFTEQRLPRLKPNTQKEYRSKLRIIDRWAGPEQVAHITRARVRKLRDVLLKPDKDGIVALNRAHGTMRVLRTLLQFAIDDSEFLPDGATNPAAEQDMPAPPPRDIVWSPAAVDLMVECAGEAGQPSLALAILLARETAQRESDLLKLSMRHWCTIPRHKMDPADWDRLAEPDASGAPVVLGIRLTQDKTSLPIEVPVVGATRRLVEQAIADARAANSTVILLERRTVTIEGKEQQRLAAWTETRFQRTIAALRESAIAKATEEGSEELAEELASLQFRDLRRTAVVWLGELGIPDHLIAAITGHKIEYTKQILETYLPRNTAMAAKGIVLRLERDPALREADTAKEKKA